MKEYIYPAIFHKNDDGSFTVTFPDLPGCITEGKTMGDAIKMAQSALTQWIEFLRDEKEDIPIASEYDAVEKADGEAISLVQADVRDNRAVKRTVSLPKWMDDRLSEAGFSLSKLIQEADRQMRDKLEGRVPLSPLHNENLKPGTYNNILKQAGLK